MDLESEGQCEKRSIYSPIVESFYMYDTSEKDN